MVQDKKCAMGRNNPKLIIGFVVVILLVGFYAAPLLLNANKSFTLYPKNIPNFNATYSLIFTFRESVLKLMRFPLWQPLFSGGAFALAHPGENSSSIFSVLALPMGEVECVNLSFFFASILGACSMFYLMRRTLKCSFFGAVFSALVFSMSGFFAYLFENGLFYCKELLFLPLLLIFFIKAKENLKFIIPCGFVLALIFFQAGLFFPVIVLFLLLFALLFGLQGNARCISWDITYFRNLIFLGPLTFLLSAVKLFPLLILIGKNNRISGFNYTDAIRDANTLDLFIQRALVPAHAGAGTMYVGFLPLMLCFFSLALFRETRRFFVLLLVFVILSFGPNSMIDLHRLLWNVPIFNSMSEIAKYYAIIIVFLVAILAGKSFDLFERSKNKIISVLIPTVLISVVFFDLLNANTGYFNAFNTKLSFRKATKNNFHVAGLNVHSGDESILNSLDYFLIKKNIGLINPLDPLGRDVMVTPKFYLLPQYAFLSPFTSLLVLQNPDYKGEVYFTDKKNTARLVEMSPNVIVVEARAVSPDRLIINQNYDQGWTTGYGKVENYHGLISIKVSAPGEKLIRLEYVPKIFYFGLLLSLATFLSACYLFTRKEKRHAR